MIKKIMVILLALSLCAGFGIILLQFTQLPDGSIHDYSVSGEDGKPVADAGGWRFYLNEEGVVTPLEFHSFGMCTGLKYNGQTFYASMRLPESEVLFPMLSLQLASQRVCLYLDDRLIYTNCPQSAGPAGFLQLPWEEEDSLYQTVLVSLPANCRGKTLTIAQSSSPFEEIEGQINMAIPCDVRFYDGGAYETALISSTSKTLYPAAGLFMIGLILLLFFVYQTFQQRLNMGLFFMAAAAFAHMTYLLIHSPLASFYPVLTEYFPDDLFYYLRFMMILLFLFFHMKLRSRHVLGAVMALQAVAMILYYALIRTDFLPYGDFYVFLMFIPEKLLVIALLIVILLAALEAKKGSRFFRMFLFFTGITAAAYLIFCGLTIPFGTQYAKSVLERLAGALRLNVWTFPLLLSQNLLLITGVAAAIWDAISSLVQLHTDTRMLALKYQASETSYHSIRLQHEQVMMLRHDLNNHLAMLSAFMEGQDYQRAKDYLDEIVKQGKKIPDIINTSHNIINIVLNSKLSTALDSGVHLNIERAAAPSSLPISDKDLCALIMNIMDNAIAGALSSGTDEPYISLDLHVKDSYFFFSCENSSSGDCSTKTEVYDKKTDLDFAPEKHGYGLKIINHIVEKNNGIFRFAPGSAAFTATFILPVR